MGGKSKLTLEGIGTMEAAASCLSRSQYLVPSTEKIDKHNKRNRRACSVLGTRYSVLRFSACRNNLQSLLGAFGRRQKRQVNLNHQSAFSPILSRNPTAVEADGAFRNG
jgi:hypothetical protein